MKLCLSALLGLVLVAGCTSTPDDSMVGTLSIYDWLDRTMGEYAAALDQGRRDTQAMLAQKLKVQIDRRYDSIVEKSRDENDPTNREIAVSALGFSQRPEAIVHLEPRLTDPVPGVRGSAAAAIGFLDPPQPPIEKIEPLLSEPDRFARHAALFAIKLLARPGQLPSKAGLERIKALAREDALFEIRNEAVLALGRIQDEKSIDLLSRQALKDESFLVRGNAALMLAGFGPKARPAVPFLIERLKDGETSVAEKAHYALKIITGLVDLDRSYGGWADWLNEISKVLEFHCLKDGKVSSSPGPCPECGVVMEPRAIQGAEFACPEHKDQTSSKPDKCPKCEKEMLPRKRNQDK